MADEKTIEAFGPEEFLSGLPEQLQQAVCRGVDTLSRLQRSECEELLNEIVLKENLPPDAYGSPVSAAVAAHALDGSSASDIGSAVMILTAVATHEEEDHGIKSALESLGVTYERVEEFLAWFRDWMEGQEDNAKKWSGSANLVRRFVDLVYAIDMLPNVTYLPTPYDGDAEIFSASVQIETFRSDERITFSLTEEQLGRLASDIDELRKKIKSMRSKNGQ